MPLVVSEVRIAVLVSGSGSNLQALLEADLGPGDIVVVIANVPGARALDRARDAGVESVIIDHRAFPDRTSFDLALLKELEKYRVEWVVLAGFMRILTNVILDPFRDRVVNIHPALLPSFPGTHAQERALAAGAKISGCTVHLVDEGTDTGLVLAQAAVPVLPDDDESRLANRILREEHRIFPAVVRALAEGRLEIEKGLPRRASLRGFSCDALQLVLSPNFALRRGGTA